MNSSTQTNLGPFALGAYTAQGAQENAPGALDVLRGEVRVEMRAMRNTIARLASRDMSAQLHELQSALEDLKSKAPQSKGARAIASMLDDAGIEGPAAARMKRAMAKTMRDVKYVTLVAGALMADAWNDALRELIQVAPWPVASRESNNVIVLIGSSGVGKTTTSAKLAARFLAEGRDVTLVACDHFRVGAAHQLGRYAELMGAGFAKATNDVEMDRVVNANPKSIVIIDTAGCLPADATLAKLGARTSRNVTTLLCVPACIRARDAAFAARSFAPSGPTAICITKIDETESPAGLVHARVAASLPISILCNGPRVPEDIASATNAAIIDALGRKS